MMRLQVLIHVSILLATAANSRMASVVAFAASSFTEIVPLKASMVTKTWQSLLLDVDQKVGVVPELGSTSVGVKRFGPELERRTKCARQFERFFEANFALATCDKTAEPAAKRLTIPLLLIDGKARGPACKTYASLTSPATMALVEQNDDDDNPCCWSVLMLIVNPTERSEDVIVAAERTMLQQLCALAKLSSGSVRVLDKAQETLAGDAETLGLSATPKEDLEDSDSDPVTVWYRCEL
mmetsp:Transcript_3877/g.10981  ORF Transcript_3877/g.10981 Transcript_3877/m.10981 type:complete len:239 (+) Transcript_3877:134-850(+)